jgi:hypothetical protein
MEPLWVLLTGLRKFHCLDCDKIFRAPDRRKKPRTEADNGVWNQDAGRSA